MGRLYKCSKCCLQLNSRKSVRRHEDRNVCMLFETKRVKRGDTFICQNCNMSTKYKSSFSRHLNFCKSIEPSLGTVKIINVDDEFASLQQIEVDEIIFPEESVLELDSWLSDCEYRPFYKTF